MTYFVPTANYFQPIPAPNLYEPNNNPYFPPLLCQYQPLDFVSQPQEQPSQNQRSLINPAAIELWKAVQETQGGKPRNPSSWLQGRYSSTCLAWLEEFSKNKKMVAEGVTSPSLTSLSQFGSSIQYKFLDCILNMQLIKYEGRQYSKLKEWMNSGSTSLGKEGWDAEPGSLVKYPSVENLRGPDRTQEEYYLTSKNEDRQSLALPVPPNLNMPYVSRKQFIRECSISPVGDNSSTIITEEVPHSDAVKLAGVFEMYNCYQQLLHLQQERVECEETLGVRRSFMSVVIPDEFTKQNVLNLLRFNRYHIIALMELIIACENKYKYAFPFVVFQLHTVIQASLCTWKSLHRETVEAIRCQMEQEKVVSQLQQLHKAISDLRHVLRSIFSQCGNKKSLVCNN